MDAQTPIENKDVKHAAAGCIAYLLSLIRNGDTLSPKEEEYIRTVIKDLGE